MINILKPWWRWDVYFNWEESHFLVPSFISSASLSFHCFTHFLPDFLLLILYLFSSFTVSHHPFAAPLYLFLETFDSGLITNSTFSLLIWHPLSNQDFLWKFKALCPHVIHSFYSISSAFLTRFPFSNHMQSNGMGVKERKGLTWNDFE